jgi:microcystin degradation protein MlrC
VPLSHARAEPGAAVDPAAYRELESRLLDQVAEAGPAELVLLDLHGAGSLTTGDSLDLALVRRLRGQLPPDTVLAITLDLHANLPDELVPLVDVVVGFQNYPHTDMAVRAELAADIAIRQVRGQVRPVVRKLDLPMLLPPSTTLAGAGAAARAVVREQEELEGVLACTLFHGFPFVDSAHARTSVVSIADGSAALADQVNRQVADWLWAHRDEFRVIPLSPQEAVRQALATEQRPVVIGDGTDNPGSGAPGDSTYLLSALLDSGARAAFATLHDPAAVATAVAAGAGAEVSLELGGRHGWASGPPLPVRAAVRSITDGRVVQQSMRRGKTLEFGLSVGLRIGSLDVIVTSDRRQVFDPEIFILHGMPPERYDIVAVKSVNHFRAGFAAVSGQMMVADAPGPFTRDITALPRRGPTAALWPMTERPDVPGQPAEETAGSRPVEAT